MFKLAPNPTFWAKVEIAAPGGDPSVLEVEFRHFGRKALTELRERMEGRPKVAMLHEIVVGWRGADREFSSAALEDLDDAHLAAADALIQCYLEEMTGANRKN